jgi:hypothetical protein
MPEGNMSEEDAQKALRSSVLDELWEDIVRHAFDYLGGDIITAQSILAGGCPPGTFPFTSSLTHQEQLDDTERT